MSVVESHKKVKRVSASRGWARSGLWKADLFIDQFANFFTPHDIITNIIPNTSIAKGNPIRFSSSLEVLSQGNGPIGF